MGLVQRERTAQSLPIQWLHSILEYDPARFQLRRVSSVYDPRYQAVIQRLVAIRREEGVTQQELADRLGNFRQPDVAKVEGLQRRLDLIELIDWLDALGRSNLEVSSILSMRLESG